MEEESEYSDASEAEVQTKRRKEYDSDALDDDSEDDVKPTKGKKSPTKPNGRAKQPPKASPRKKKKAAEEDYEDSEDDLKEGQEVVGRVVQAPTTGRGPYIIELAYTAPNSLYSPARTGIEEYIRFLEPSKGPSL